MPILGTRWKREGGMIFLTIHSAAKSKDDKYTKIKTTMGRKRKQGKARKAAKAKARQEAEERENNNNRAAQMRRSWLLLPCKCKHGAGPLPSPSRESIFAAAFELSFREATGDYLGIQLCGLIEEAKNDTLDEFPDVWIDSAKLKTAIHTILFLGIGTQDVLEEEYDSARDNATIIRYLEQYIAVELHHRQALYHCPKLDDSSMQMNTRLSNSSGIASPAPVWMRNIKK